MYHRYTTQELCNAVYLAVSSSDKPLSRLEICEKIGRHKSPHIVAMIDHLNQTGYLNRELADNKWGKQEFRYFVDKKPSEAACANWLG